LPLPVFRRRPGPERSDAKDLRILTATQASNIVLPPALKTSARSAATHRFRGRQFTPFKQPQNVLKRHYLPSNRPQMTEQLRLLIDRLVGVAGYF
jgi:hypothetical protein